MYIATIRKQYAPLPQNNTNYFYTIATAIRVMLGLADMLLTPEALTPEQHEAWRVCFAPPVPALPVALTKSDLMRALCAKYKLTTHYKMLPAQVSAAFSEAAQKPV